MRLPLRGKIRHYSVQHRKAGQSDPQTAALRCFDQAVLKECCDTSRIELPAGNLLVARDIDAFGEPPRSP
jgi:hypothetical protein